MSASAWLPGYSILSSCETELFRVAPAPRCETARHRYVDCARGYAILMVITCHLAYLFPALPYPVHRVVVCGWFGVQLFFIASATTLLQSWRSEQDRMGGVSVPAFYARRVFRIAPAYYLAGVLTMAFTAASPGAWRIVISAGFLNALTPSWARTSQGILPGGWSIGAEFAFYAVFPIFAALVISGRRAVVAFAGAVLFGLLANAVALPLVAGRMSGADVSEGLFFWFPNQACVFALGGIAYFAIRAQAGFVQRRSGAILAASGVAFVVLPWLPLGHYLGDAPPLPAMLVASVILAVAFVALSASRGWPVNRAVARIGEVSFSAYLVHFAILAALARFPGFIHASATGMWAVAAFAACWPVAILLVYAVSWLSYRLVELPMIRVGRVLVAAFERSGALVKQSRAL